MLMDLRDTTAAEQYYESRYRAGYMDFWDRTDLTRLADVLTKVTLQSRARILDFGCGTGLVTALLKQHFRDCDVYGCDISPTSVAVARARHPEATFAKLDDDFVHTNAGAFDLVFSHHVLEHVFDLDKSAATIAMLAKPQSIMLHVLPCGNSGSFEHRLCQLRTGGIEVERGKRFFFEEEGHLRRLTTDEVVDVFAPAGYRLRYAFYGNQFWGGVEWLTRLHPRFALAIFNPFAVGTKKPLRWLAYSMPLMVLYLARIPVLALTLLGRRARQRFLYRSKPVSIADLSAVTLVTLPLLPLAVFSAAIAAALRAAARREWSKRKEHRNGSSMYLIFDRQ
jgi:SAM-dependent methyltransferase